MLGTSAFGIEEVCRMRANESSLTKVLAAKADELEQTWSTTGYYTWDEMSRMILAIGNLTREVSYSANAQLARYATPGLTSARDAYFEIQKRALNYTADWQAAKAKNALIDAPAFKRWVIAVLRAANKLMYETEVTACQEPWWLPALTAYVGTFNYVVGIAKAIGRAVVAIGQNVVKAAEGLFGAWPYIKWGAISFGALAVTVFAYNKLVVTAEAGRKKIDWSSVRMKLFPKRG